MSHSNIWGSGSGGSNTWLSPFGTLLFISRVEPSQHWLIRARARKVPGAPAVSLAGKVQRNLLLLIFLLRNRIFEGLGMHEDSQKLVHTSELANIAYFCSDWAWAWPAGSIAPPPQCKPELMGGGIIALIYKNISKHFHPIGSQPFGILCVSFHFIVT